MKAGDIIFVKAVVADICDPLGDELDLYPEDPVVQIRTAHPSVGISGCIEEAPQSQTFQISDLAELLGAAEAFAEDLRTGLADGTYEDRGNLDEIEAAIERAQAVVNHPMRESE